MKAVLKDHGVIHIIGETPMENEALRKAWNKGSYAFDEFSNMFTDNHIEISIKPEVKFGIDLTPQHIKILHHWASVGRTLTESERLLHGYSNLSEDPDSAESIDFNVEELEELHAPLEALHMAYREYLNKKLSTG